MVHTLAGLTLPSQRGSAKTCLDVRSGSIAVGNTPSQNVEKSLGLSSAPHLQRRDVTENASAINHSHALRRKDRQDSYCSPHNARKRVALTSLCGGLGTAISCFARVAAWHALRRCSSGRRCWCRRCCANGRHHRRGRRPDRQRRCAQHDTRRGHGRRGIHAEAARIGSSGCTSGRVRPRLDLRQRWRSRSVAQAARKLCRRSNCR